MLRRLERYALLATLLLAFGCGKGADEGKAADGGTPAAAATDDTPAATPVNQLELATLTATGPKEARWEEFGGRFDMKTAVLTWDKDEVYLFLANEAVGCDLVKGAGVTKGAVRATVQVPLSEAQRTGAEPLDGKEFKAKRAVIFARAFNSMLMPRERTVHFTSGRVKVGEKVAGWMQIVSPNHGRDDASFIKGRFEAEVCAGKDLPKREPLPPALGPCPSETKLTALRTTSGQYDPATFTIAKAKWQDDGARLSIFIANADFPLKRMGGLGSPVKRDGDAVLTLELYGEPGKWATIGKYDQHGYKKPRSFTVGMLLPNRHASPGFRQGWIKIIDLRDDRVCGELSVQNERGTAAAAGTFVAPLPAP